MRHINRRIARNACWKECGFTLIEIMVVLVICLGLVTLMTSLYRSVGKSAIALRGGHQEWAVRQQLRDQFQHLFDLAGETNYPVIGHPTELYLIGWKSKAASLNGKPVFVRYHYDSGERALYYQEYPLPSWWEDNRVARNAMSKDAEILAAPSTKVLTGAEALSWSYLPTTAPNTNTLWWLNEWRLKEPPKLIQLQFSKAGRRYTILFDTRVTHG